MSIVVIVDNGASLPSAVVKRKDVCVVPLNIELQDGRKMELVESNVAGEVPFSLNIHKPDILQVRETVLKYINQGDDVLYITISSKLSKEYEEIEKLRNELSSFAFKVVDSLNVGSGLTLLVMLALEKIDEGFGFKQTYNYLEIVKREIKSTYVIANFPFLYSQDICKDLRYKYLIYKDRYPIMNLLNGDTKVSFNSSKLEVGYSILEDNIVDNISNTKENMVIIHYVENREKAEAIKKSLKRKCSNIDVQIIKADSFLNLCLGEEGLSFSIVNK